MGKQGLAVLFALGAAVLIGIGNVIHERSAHTVTDAKVGNLALFLHLLRDRQWWVGSIVSTVGFGLQAAALGVGSVVLVQSILVTALLFALPLNARLTGQPVTRAQWGWAGMLAVSVAVIVAVGNPSAGQSRAALEVWALVIAVLGPTLVLCVVLARAMAGRPAAAVLLSVVSGTLWGVVAVLTKGVVDRLDHGVAAVLATPELYAWAVAGIAATAWQQSAFRAGSLAASLPTMTVVEPVVGAVLGMLVLGETVRPGDDGWAALIAAVVATVVATAALARSQATTGVLPVNVRSQSGG